MAIRAVYFDIGGVILRTENPEPRREWERRLGLQSGQLVKIVFDNPVAQQSTAGEATESDVWREVGRSLNLSRQQLMELREDFFAGDQWDENLLAFIRKLRTRIRTGVISNGWLGAQAAMTKRINAATFDTIVFSGVEKCRKPDEKIYRLALARLGVSPGEAMFFDDFQENVDGANRIGMQAVLFEGPHQAIEMIRKIFMHTRPL
ncbi:MAG: HAD family phosphatase [Anaerolineales bacterium]|nr:HAD family phosphatase [Anaerolineales bacterium]